MAKTNAERQKVWRERQRQNRIYKANERIRNTHRRQQISETQLITHNHNGKLAIRKWRQALAENKTEIHHIETNLHSGELPVEFKVSCKTAQGSSKRYIHTPSSKDSRLLCTASRKDKTYRKRSGDSCQKILRRWCHFTGHAWKSRSNGYLGRWEKINSPETTPDNDNKRSLCFIS